CPFFLSNRRRHRYPKRDWSSDVCSSFLLIMIYFTSSDFWKFIGLEIDHYEAGSVRLKLPIKPSFHNIQHIVHGGIFASILDTSKIGRASCREPCQIEFA